MSSAALSGHLYFLNTCLKREFHTQYRLGRHSQNANRDINPQIPPSRSLCKVNRTVNTCASSYMIAINILSALFLKLEIWHHSLEGKGGP